MVRTQRGDALAGPAIAVAGLEPVAIEKAGDQIVACDQRQFAYGGNDVGGCAVALSAPALGQAKLAVRATRPMDGDDDFGSVVVDIGHDFVDQRARDALLQSRVRRRSRPDRFEVRSQQGKRGWIDRRRRRSRLVRNNLAFKVGDADKCSIPARLEFAGD
jgi:hypothetical protein